MDRQSVLLIELPHLSDQSACELLELLDLLEQLFAGIDSHYLAQVARYRQHQHEDHHRHQPDLFKETDPPF